MLQRRIIRLDSDRLHDHRLTSILGYGSSAIPPMPPSFAQGVAWSSLKWSVEAVGRARVRISHEAPFNDARDHDAGSLVELQPHAEE